MHEYSLAQVLIEHAEREAPKMVVMATGVGGTRVVDLHPGEILPRIC